MLDALSGETHVVVSGLCLRTPAWEVVEHATTRVTFRPLTPRDVADYVASGEWEGRAGGYAIQGFGAASSQRIEGDYLNVVGLPAALLVSVLAERFAGLRLRLASALRATRAEPASRVCRARRKPAAARTATTATRTASYASPGTSTSTMCGNCCAWRPDALPAPPRLSAVGLPGRGEHDDRSRTETHPGDPPTSARRPTPRAPPPDAPPLHDSAETRKSASRKTSPAT